MSYSQVNSGSSNAWGDSSKNNNISLDEDDDHFLIDDDSVFAQDNDGFIQPDHAIPSNAPESSAFRSSAAGLALPTDGSSNGPPPYSLESRISQATGQTFEQRRFMGGDTLDEPITATLMRDVRSVGWRLRQVIWYTPASSLQASGMVPSAVPFQDYSGVGQVPVNQEWDLWGPLIFCLIISLCLSMIAPNHQSSLVFSGVFALISLGQVTVTLNIKLLGGSISFFSALCTIGYCLFPLVPAVLLSTFVRLVLVRIIVDTLLVIWAIYSATKGLQDSGVLPSRVFLASFPVGLFFTGLGWLCVIS